VHAARRIADWFTVRRRQQWPSNRQARQSEAQDEGTRIGTVRRPPRGVPKSQFAARDFYDVCFHLARVSRR